ncbi:membrane protein of unknown function [Alkaliphilus metalliredigens QYMF]|uniref:Phage holin family protein n=1 Tax=Alkaliphilus metalliredigens (strain QYMF) TaxID=293826 RepID=A6TQ99_ALKMQ|nr:phage holin family protein [Alkaliphilus metalliredigens]ABR48367.1 membrane protein of unknown function [Alkaliphilus metalliredigens QYMF]
MTKFLVRWFSSAAAVYIIASIYDGISVTGFQATLITAAILGIVNMFIKPILLILTLPITLLTLGLFTFVINGIILFITANLVAGFQVKSLFAAIIGSLLISVVNMVINNVLGVKK